SRRPPRSPSLPYTTLFRSRRLRCCLGLPPRKRALRCAPPLESGVTIKRGLELAFEFNLLVRQFGDGVTLAIRGVEERRAHGGAQDRKSTRLNSSHVKISYA